MRTSRNRVRVATLAVTLVVAAACSSPQGTEQPQNSLLGKDGKQGSDRNRGAEKGKGGRKQGGQKVPGGRTGVPSAPPAVAVPTPGEDGKGLSGASRTETEVASSGQDPRTASVLVTEPDPDADKSGIAPDFPDILSTLVEGAGPNLRVTIVFHGDVPDKMPDDKTYMVAGFGLTPEKKSQGYAFGASADDKGWTAYGGSDTGGEFEGDFSISGDTVVFTVPWSIMGGPQAFKWYSQASWFKSLAGTTHYSLDALPNEGPARYPAG